MAQFDDLPTKIYWWFSIAVLNYKRFFHRTFLSDWYFQSILNKSFRHWKPDHQPIISNSVWIEITKTCVKLAPNSLNCKLKYKTT